MYIDDVITDLKRIHGKLKEFEGGQNAYIGDQCDALDAIVARLGGDGIADDGTIADAWSHIELLLECGYGLNINEESGRYGEYARIKEGTVIKSGWDKGKPVLSVNYEPGIVAYPDAWDFEPIHYASAPIEVVQLLEGE